MNPKSGPSLGRVACSVNFTSGWNGSCRHLISADSFFENRLGEVISCGSCFLPLIKVVSMFICINPLHFYASKWLGAIPRNVSCFRACLCHAGLIGISFSMLSTPIYFLFFGVGLRKNSSSFPLNMWETIHAKLRKSSKHTIVSMQTEVMFPPYLETVISKFG